MGITPLDPSRQLKNACQMPDPEKEKGRRKGKRKSKAGSCMQKGEVFLWKGLSLSSFPTACFCFSFSFYPRYYRET